MAPSDREEVSPSYESGFKKYLEYKPDAHLILSGHADKRGTADYNEALSERRVGATKQFLIKEGVPEGNVEPRGLGSQENLTAA
jgi:outer membrane protein OmpA-like peptidoglycan-associated protein